MKFLHAMIRVSDPEATIRFFKLLGLEEKKRMENEQGRFTLIFLGVPGDDGGRSSSPTIGMRPAMAAAATSATSPTRSTTFTRPAGG
jgi:catechol 2,3-dioxygenase-like lactoylglutathione lyase family enzyme